MISNVLSQSGIFFGYENSPEHGLDLETLNSRLDEISDKKLQSRFDALRRREKPADQLKALRDQLIALDEAGGDPISEKEEGLAVRLAQISLLPFNETRSSKDQPRVLTESGQANSSSSEETVIKCHSLFRKLLAERDQIIQEKMKDLRALQQSTVRHQQSTQIQELRDLQQRVVYLERQHDKCWTLENGLKSLFNPMYRFFRNIVPW